MHADADTRTPGEDEDDDHDVFSCYRHPDRETGLRCITCERPVCIDCAVQAAVGIKCPDCGRLPRAARAKVPVVGLARGIVAAALVAIVLGALLWWFRLPFEIILGYLAGMAIGEAARRGSGGFRDLALARAAALSAFVGVLALPVLTSLPTPGGGLVWSVAAAAFAAYGAWSRAH